MLQALKTEREKKGKRRDQNDPLLNRDREAESRDLRALSVAPYRVRLIRSRRLRQSRVGKLQRREWKKGRWWGVVQNLKRELLKKGVGVRATLSGGADARGEARLHIAGAKLTGIRKVASRCSRAVEVADTENKERNFERERALRRGKVSHV